MLLGWILLDSQLLHLFIRFLVVFCCRSHQSTDSNCQLKHADSILSQFSAACASFVYQSILLHTLDAIRLFSGFSAHSFAKPHTRCISASDLASRTTPSHAGLSAESFRTRRTSTPRSPDAPGCIRCQWGGRVARGVCFPTAAILHHRLASHSRHSSP